MLIGISGQMGAGKTLSQTILGVYLARLTGAPLWSNYQINHPCWSGRIATLSQISEVDSAIFLFDEIWISADARAWKDNVRLTQWINQTRKKKMVIMYTTQHIRQVEMRVRNGTDLLIACEKRGTDHRLTFIDWQYRRILRTFVLPSNPAYWKLYDTYEVLSPLGWSKNKKGKENNEYTGF